MTAELGRLSSTSLAVSGYKRGSVSPRFHAQLHDPEMKQSTFFPSHHSGFILPTAPGSITDPGEVNILTNKKPPPPCEGGSTVAEG